MGRASSELAESDILVDTREQRPYWPGATRATLKTGDYSVAGLAGAVAVERKSISDLLGSLGGRGGVRRRRLEAEFERLGQLRAGAVVIEGTPGGVYAFPTYGKITGAHAIMAMVSWSIRYRVAVFFADDRVTAKSLTRAYLRHARRILAEEAAA